MSTFTLTNITLLMIKLIIRSIKLTKLTTKQKRGHLAMNKANKYAKKSKTYKFHFGFYQFSIVIKNRLSDGF